MPRDDRPHDAAVEWWYFNGHLTADDGQRFAVMTCLFKIKPRLFAHPMFAAVRQREVWFIHSLLDELPRGRRHRRIIPLTWPRLPAVDPVGAGAFRWVRVDDLGRSHLTSPFFNVDLVERKRPLLVGGRGVIDLGVKRTAYLSRTRLEARGLVLLARRQVGVRGLLWHDHQWSDDPADAAEDRWVWWSVQLEDGTDLLVFRYGATKPFTHATVSWPNGRTAVSRQVELSPLEVPWRSRTSRVDYPLSWQVSVADLGLSFIAHPVRVAGEMIFGDIAYWEGSVEVQARVRGKPVPGVGFLEIVGNRLHRSRSSRAVRAVQAMVRRQLASWVVSRYERGHTT